MEYARYGGILMDKQVPENPVQKNRGTDFTPLTIITALMVCFYIMANIMSVKLIGIWDVAVLDMGTLTFPVTYILGAILAEIWGFRMARRIILLTFICNIIFVCITGLGVLIPSPDYLADNADAYDFVFSYVPRIIFASLIAFLSGELTNAWLMVKIRKLTSGKFLWLRTIGSTGAGFLIDTIIFCTFAFAGIAKTRDLFIIMGVNYLIKMLVSVFLGTPICYAVCGLLRRHHSK